jgi:GABA(A) receptor-associated protein
MSDFKKNHTFDERSSEAKRILEKYPDRIPIIIENNQDCKTLPKISKNIYLVPNNITMGQLIRIVKRRIQVSPEMAVFAIVENTIPTYEQKIIDIHQSHKEDCGFLYITICTENTFG